MFTILDLDLAHGRRDEVARRVGAARPETGSEGGRARRGGRWPSRFARMLRGPSGVGAGRPRGPASAKI